MTLEEIELQIIECCGPRHCKPGDHDYECCVHHNPKLAERIAAAIKAEGARVGLAVDAYFGPGSMARAAGKP